MKIKHFCGFRDSFRGRGRRIWSRLPARSVLLYFVQRSPPETRTPQHAPRASEYKSFYSMPKQKRSPFGNRFVLAGAEGLGLACRLGRCFCTSYRGLRRRPAPLNTLRVPRSLNHFTQCQNKNGHLSATVFALAGAEGLEPSARGFGDRCSTN